MTQRLLGVLLLAACTTSCTQASRGVRVSDAAQHIVPQSSNRSQTGTLVAHVHGTPREIEYHVNGIRIEPNKPWSRGQDARLELELQPGRYTLEARYKVRLFAGETSENRIVTRAPVDVLPGQTTHLVADLKKNWRGVPLRAVTHFEVVTPETERRVGEVLANSPRFSSRQIPIELALPEVDETNADAYLESMHAANRESQRADFIVIRGNTSAPSDAALFGDRIRIEPAGGVRRPTNHIVIRGDDVVTEDTASPDPTPVRPAPEPLRAPVAVRDLEPPTQRPFEIEIQIESRPEGTDVRLDDNLVGRTPLRIHVDPRQDHVLSLERFGCDPHVRLLSSASWERGRSPVVQVDLDCE